jgi:hypothetical protein
VEAVLSEIVARQVAGRVDDESDAHGFPPVTDRRA